MTGDRGPVLQVALIVGGSYALYIRPISFKRLMFFIFLGAFVFAILRFGRGRDAGEFNDGNIFQRGYASYSESEQGVNVTDELATSVRIQYRALDVVPHKHPYLYGLTFATVGVGIIPFAGSTVISIFEIPKMYAGSAMFFTIIGQGPNPTYGEGSEILGDIYINFGLYGTFIIMFFFGLFSAKIYQRANRLEFSYVLIFLGLLISAITINRGMLFTPLKDIVYLLFFNFLFTRVVK
jgi:oligosaccharide repeat unit polymerase